MKKCFFTFYVLFLIALSLAGCGRIRSGVQSPGLSGAGEGVSPSKALMVVKSARLEHTSAEGQAEGWSDGFGAAIAVGENVLAVGAPSASDGTKFHDGIVFLYRKRSGQWIEEAQLSPSEHERYVNREFGSTLAFSGDLLYIGAPGAGDPQKSRMSGLVYVF